MAAKRRALPVLEGAQAAAVDPQVHATLSASAGTGKTQVLTGRVLRLLLSGASPVTILCLTFTKAGAAEMANRIGAQLASWVRMKEPDLKKDLFALGERDDPLTRQRARRLFAKVLDAPGGLRIQTIHGFAQRRLASAMARNRSQSKRSSPQWWARYSSSDSSGRFITRRRRGSMLAGAPKPAIASAARAQRIK